MSLSSADFARARGWKVGTVIYGGPIMHNGKQTERPRHVRITAIGEDRTLGRARIVGEETWSSEASYEFTAREWTTASNPIPDTRSTP